MAVTSALVLLAVCWFMTLFIVLPLVTRTQADEGEVVPGTHASSPANFNPKRTALIVTAVAVPIWIVLSGIIVSGKVGIDDLDLFKRFGPSAPITDGTGG